MWYCVQASEYWFAGPARDLDGRCPPNDRRGQGERIALALKPAPTAQLARRAVPP